MINTKEDIIQKLTKFRLVNKYEAFYEAMPEVRFTDVSQRGIVSGILNECCRELLALFNSAKKKPAKTSIKKVLQKAMTSILHEALDDENKEFAYKLCWFLAAKVELNLPKQSAKKYWGYWQVIDDEVKTINYRKPKKKLGE